ncbi:MAG: type II toxin-antitoxin system VapC family toxin [Microcystis panniformis Mp_MB_F_20051200_S9]|uniref:Type II toxin-antitoxin system VapC family toxin n=1 Tax=Microcystis panniformis Mp_MB_F_20051200_S9 TaxID=2486223 RepID=A0A552PP01_9CHRO|nr:MAG: type II toxin-antitoxin system VapC family toxin [Microcystis panniformis Mp_MB_F_20080800_S26D]TRV43457.1 MAG: type II toxin-antitoxin system VapC family toxin [Microcystis panniformis Mp_GB_SS_20050300_S99]TRV53773.1 MAG: type II toxin-antitoxin system VapC family toxin [Microcystis panniformis Mp_GB_SS_20050300_S99D]TRV58662.1 MAG: type II toxin-antitoxin system VapC family toxin [Microcystis panniformis Mp_MB_F_20051200_S9]TRV61250.1 MAG: type II toxin-antitoxin system VapC family t
MSYLLDTNIVSLIIKRNLEIYQKIEDVKAQRQSIFISCITYFEIKRGFLAVAAPKQRERFDQLCQDYQIILLDDLAILEKVSEIHADLRLRGLPIQTEDILIAATAIVKSLIVVSNDSDLLRVEGLSLENWVEL